MTGETPGELPIELINEQRYRVYLPQLDYLNLLTPRRPAEVALVIQRTPGWILLHSKRHYPPGTFRIPTGTMRKGETTEQTMLRELREEANLVPGRHRKLFRLDYDVAGGRKDFFTEAYLIEAPQGQLHPIDRTEAIVAWREALVTELPAVARELRRLSDARGGWGLFRSAVHQLLAQLLPSPVLAD